MHADEARAMADAAKLAKEVTALMVEVCEIEKAYAAALKYSCKLLNEKIPAAAAEGFTAYAAKDDIPFDILTSYKTATVFHDEVAEIAEKFGYTYVKGGRHYVVKW